MTPSRWEIVQEGGNGRYFLNTTNFSNGGTDLLGEYAVAQGRSYGDFTMSVDVRSNENLGSNAFADYAIIFGWIDEQNHYHLLANSDDVSSELYVLQNGSRTALGRTPTPAIQDNEWHTVEISRTGDLIELRIDGILQITANDSTYPTGSVGIGSRNDSAYFDNISVSSSSSGNGDLNGDRHVDIFDLVMIFKNFGLSSNDPGYDPRADVAAPFDEVDISDLFVVANNFGNNY